VHDYSLANERKNKCGRQPSLDKKAVKKIKKAVLKNR